jgi:hypothetical protein
MLHALATTLMLTGLWNLLFLLTETRQRDSYAGENTRPIFFPEYRRQRQKSLWLVCGAVSLPLACATLASLHGSAGMMGLGAGAGLYLFLGTGYVYRVLDRLPAYGRSDDPSLHVLALVLCWPFWAMPGTGRQR